jgi:Skp family chaperone for outer membrane proteins
VRRILVLLLILAAAGTASAQQFAKTGVVNLTRVSQFYKDARAKAVEDLKASIQKDLDAMRDEIRGLVDQRAEAAKAGDNAKVQALDTQIQAKKAAFSDFGHAKQQELAAAGEALKNDTSFQKWLPQEIEQAAISKGFGLIINSSNPAVLWYGPDADITDDVIQRLQADLAR